MLTLFFAARAVFGAGRLRVNFTLPALPCGIFLGKRRG